MALMVGYQVSTCTKEMPLMILLGVGCAAIASEVKPLKKRVLAAFGRQNAN